ncbi:NADPH-dependent FMN reductase [Pseudooceanicola sp.]|uniref:NADPH-dependent FMN reductase n=1 Tax=Pseudooceanicola sp. TaxID=1914328 RepID=UPI002612A19C|nr:NADPH-dependent FMN reductase [Pseudooceanicola sp.]MDF1854016.1 NAD(P)H-dependent oxidoreductase [Pseudooceanicola sp.]
MRILGLCGSLRAESSNMALLRGLAEVAPMGMDLRLRTPAGLPLFSPDLEGPPAAQAVEAFAAEVGAADGMVIACPEYVHALPGAFKNALDWLVSRDEIIGKPIALLHATHRGADVARQLHLVLGTLSERFWPDLEARFHLMRQTPDEISAHLRMPVNRQILQQFLSDFTGRIQTRGDVGE